LSNNKLNNIATILSDAVYALFPQQCAVCGKPLVRSEEICCLNCLIDFPFIKNDTSDNPISELLYGRFPFEKASSFFYYRKQGPYSELLHKLKYSGRKDIGIWLGTLYGEQLLASQFFSDIDAIIPVPVHKKRLKQRGYNQALCICNGIHSVSGIPVVEAVQRVKFNGSLVHKTSEERWNAMQSAFVSKKELLKDCTHALLVDDVLTTGATIEATANAIFQECNIKISVCSLGFAIG